MNLRNRITEYATVQLMSGGIDGLRVDDVSSALGISKKTFYEVFDSKTQMVKKCITDVVGEYRVRLRRLGETPGKHPVDRLCELAREYVGFLYLSDRKGIMELSRKHNFSDLLEEMRSMWSEVFHVSIAGCGENLLDRIDTAGFIDAWLGSVETARQRGDSEEKGLQWACLTLRGIFNPAGMKVFDDFCRKA